MADSKTPDEGETNMDGALSGVGGIGDINKEQLAHLGGELDPIDTEDFSDADFGNEIPDDFDPKAAPIEAKTDADDSADADAEDDDEAKDKDKGDDEDADAEADAESDDSKDKADADSEEDADAESDDKDADADADDDAADKEDADQEPAKKAREQQIPKSRFDEVNARRKAAEEKLAALEAEKEAGDKAEKFDFDAAELEYLDLALAGKTADAMAKRNEIRAAEQAAYLAHAGQTATDATHGATEDGAISELVTEYEGKYDSLNPKGDTYSEDLIDEVSGMFVGYQSLGFTRPEAFKMALDNVVKIYELTEAGFDNEKGEPTTEKAEKKPTKKPIKKTKEKLAAAKKQPADPGKAGGTESSDRGKTVSLDNMSDEDLAALPDATLKRLRGDTL